MKRGEVYYISRGEPQTDSEIFSGRPAVIVSDDHLNSTSKVIEVVYLTTQTKKPMPTHAAITSSMQESTVLCEQITSVAFSRVGDYMCTLSESEMEAVNQALMASLGLKGIYADRSRFDENKIDTVYDFLKNRYTITGDRSDRIKITALYDEYTHWCLSNERTALSKKSFKERMLENGVICSPYTGIEHYKGIRKFDCADVARENYSDGAFREKRESEEITRLKIERDTYEKLVNKLLERLGA